MDAVGKTMWNNDAEDILIELVCASKERLTKVLLQQGITTNVCANTNYYGMQWLIYILMHLNNGIWKETMLHNSVDWLMTCKTFATHCAYCKTMDQTLMKLASF